MQVAFIVQLKMRLLVNYALALRIWHAPKSGHGDSPFHQPQKGETMKNGIAILVVLAPAIATAIVGFMVALLPAILTKLHSMMHSASDVEWFKELVMHSAFYGSVVAAVLGFKKEAHETAYLAAAWFVVLLYLSRLLSNRLKELEEKER